MLRIPATLGLAVAMAGTGTLVGGGQASAQAPPCQEYVVAFQTTSNGSFTGPGTTTRDPVGFSMDNRDSVHGYVGMGGVVRPRRTATFHYKDMSGVEVRTRTTAPSDDGGVLRQDKPENVMFWDLSDGSQKIQVFADFHTRCGGDDVTVTNVFVGTITTFPTPPVRLNPKYLVIGVGYAAPGPSTVDYGDSTSFGSRLSFTSSLQTGTSVTTTETLNQNAPISTTSSFSQRFQDGRSNTVEKTTSNDIIIPGPANSLDGIDHRRDRIFVWLNPTFRVSADSANSLLLNSLDVDSRDPVPFDVVQLTVAELQDRVFDAGNASRLERSWSPSGALNNDDFDRILLTDPLAGGSTVIDPERFDPLPDGSFNYAPADAGGLPITQRRTIRFSAGTTISGSATFTAGVKFDTGTNQTETMRDEAGVVFDTLKTDVKTTHMLDVTASISLDTTATTTETTTISLTGPVAGYQGPTALRAYRDKLYRTIMFAFDPVATFQIAAPSPNRTVTQGDSTAFPITTQSDFGFGNPVSFDASVVGLPAGAQATFSPASVTPPGGTTLNVTTTTQTPAGSYPLTITARSGLIVRHLTVTLLVNALPFTLSATPASQTVSSGQSTTYTVDVTAAGGFSGPVQLSGPDGLPPGASASFSRTTINGSGSATLTVATSAGTPAGTSNLTIRATGGNNVTRTAQVDLVVDNRQEFDLAVTPQAAGVFAGDTALYTITTSAINGFAGSVNLAVTGQPAGTTAAFSVNPIAGAGTSTLGIATTASTTPGNYQLTITGTSGSLSHSQTVTLTVSPPRPDFSLAATPSARSVTQGGTTTYAVSTAAIAGFTGGIGLSVSGLPAGATAGFSATPVSPGSGSTLTVSTGPSTPAGTYQLAIVGASGSLSHGQVVTLTVTAPAPDFTLAATPSSRSASQGGGTTYAISTAPVAGFTGSIDLGVTGLPAGVTASYGADPVSAGANATLSVSVGATVAPGSYSLTITGTSGGLSHSQVVTLSVTAAPSSDFTLTVDPTSTSIARGQSGAGWVQTTSVGAFADPIELSASGLPAGVTVVFDTTEVTVDSGVNMYPVVAASTAPGTYTITITGIGGSRTHSQQVTLTVT